MNRPPVLYTRKEDCCGCTACCAACPQEAIVMEDDEEGFAYPRIDGAACVGCGLCLRVCPFHAARSTCEQSR